MMDRFSKGATYAMIPRLLQLKLPTSTPAGFLINGLIMNLLQHIFSQVENPVFQFQKSRGRIFCVFPRLLLLQSKSLDFYSPGEFTGRGSETHLHKRKVEILRFRAKRALSSNLPPKRKNRPEDRSAENQENGGAF